MVWMGAATIFMQTINSIRQMISDVNDLSNAITNLRLVMGGTEESYNGMISSAKNMAVNLSANTQDILTAAQTYANAYTDANTVLARVKSAVVLSNIGGINISDSVNAVHAAAVSYKLDANDTMTVVDKMAKVASTSTVSYSQSLENLTHSFELFSSIARNTGKLSIDQLLALSQTAQDTTRLQSGVINNGLRQILVRTYRVKDPTGEVDLNSGTNAQSQLAKIGVNVVDQQTGKLKDFNTILIQTAKALKHTSEAQAELVKESMAGGRQVQIIDALLNNIDEYNNKVKASSQSAGYALKQQQIYEESSGAKIKKLQSTLYNLYTQSMDSSTIKNFLTLGNSFLTLIDKLSSSTLGFSVMFGVLTSRLISTKIATLGFTGGLKGIGGTFADLGRTLLGMNAKLDENTVKLRANKAVQAEYQASLVGGIDSTKYMKQAEKSMLATTNISGLTKKVQALESVNSMEQQGIITSERSIAMKESLNAMTNEEVATIDRKTIALKLASEAEISNGTASKILREETVALNTQEKLRETQSYKNIVAIDAEADATKAAGIATIGFGESIKALGMSVAIMAGIQIAFEGIMWVVNSIEKASEAQEKERKTIEDNIKSHAKSTESLEVLKNKYDELSNKTNKTTAENKEFTKVQNDLAKLLPNTTSYIDAQGNAHIKNANAIEKEIEKQKELNQAKLNENARKAESNINSNLNKVDENEGRKKDLQYIYDNKNKISSGEYRVKGDYLMDGQNIKYAFNDSDFSTKYVDSSKQHLQDLILSIKDLNSQYLAENKKLKVGLLENQDIYQNYSDSVKNIVLEIVQNNDKLKTQSQVTSFLGGFDRELNKKGSNIDLTQLNKLKESAESAEKSYVKFASDINNATNEVDKKTKLTNAQKAWKTYKDYITNNLADLLKNLGVSSETIKKIIGNMIPDRPKTIKVNLELPDISQLNSQLNSTMDDAEKNLKDLDSAINTLNSGNTLASKDVLDLANKYDGLKGHVENINGVFKIEKNAMEEVRKKQADVYKDRLTKMQDEIKQQENVVIAKGKLYGIDLQNYANMTEAEQKLLKEQAEQSGVDKWNDNADSAYNNYIDKWVKKNKNKNDKLKSLAGKDIDWGSWIKKNDKNSELIPDSVRTGAMKEYSKYHDQGSKKAMVNNRVKTINTMDILTGFDKSIADNLKGLNTEGFFGSDSGNGGGGDSTTSDYTNSNNYDTPSAKALTSGVDKKISDLQGTMDKQEKSQDELSTMTKKSIDAYYANRIKQQKQLSKYYLDRENILKNEQKRINTNLNANKKGSLANMYKNMFDLKEDPVKALKDGKLKVSLEALDKADDKKINALNKQLDTAVKNKNTKLATSLRKQIANLKTGEKTRQKQYTQFLSDYNAQATIGSDISSADKTKIDSSKKEGTINTEDKATTYSNQADKFIENQDKFITAHYDNSEALKKNSLDYLKTQTETVDNLNKQIALNRELALLEKQKASSYIYEEKNLKNEALKYAKDAKGKSVNIFDKTGNIIIPSNLSPANKVALEKYQAQLVELQNKYYEAKSNSAGYTSDIKDDRNKQAEAFINDLKNKSNLTALDTKQKSVEDNISLLKSQDQTVENLNKQIALNKQLIAIDKQKETTNHNLAEKTRKEIQSLGAVQNKDGTWNQSKVLDENKERIQTLIDSLKDYTDGWYSSTEAINSANKEIKDLQENQLKIASDVENKIADMIKKSKELQEKELDKELAHFKKINQSKIDELDKVYNKQKQVNEMNNKNKDIDKVQKELDTISGDTSDFAVTKRKDLQEQLDNLLNDKNSMLSEQSYNAQKQALEDLNTKKENDTQAKKDALDEKYSDENVKKISEQAVANGKILTEDIKFLSTKTKEITDQSVDLKTAFVDYTSAYGDGLTLLSTQTTDFVNNLKIAQQALKDLTNDTNKVVGSTNKSNTTPKTNNNSKTNNGISTTPKVITQEEAMAIAKKAQQKNTVKPTTSTPKTSSASNLLKNATNIGIPANVLKLIPPNILDNINESLMRTVNSSSLVPQMKTPTTPSINNINNSKTISITNHVSVNVNGAGANIQEQHNKAANQAWSGVIKGLKGQLGTW